VPAGAQSGGAAAGAGWLGYWPDPCTASSADEACVIAGEYRAAAAQADRGVDEVEDGGEEWAHVGSVGHVIGDGSGGGVRGLGESMGGAADLVIDADDVVVARAVR
jgi:hypothetical protein